MAYEFVLPDIGEGLTEAEIVRWLVPVGGTVGLDEPLVEVETDKAVVDLPSPSAGVVLHHGGAEGTVLAVGSILAVIGSADEAWPNEEGPNEEGPNEEGPNEAPTFSSSAPIVGTLVEEAEELPNRSATAAPPTTDRVLALPLVRRLARKYGVDLAGIIGTGPDGRITRDDVMAVAQGEAATAPAPVAESGEDRRLPMSPRRKAIARHMVQSWSEIPHVTTFDTANVRRLLDARAALTKRHDQPISIDALVIKAVLPALAAFPEMNAVVDGTDIVYRGRFDIGVAVDTPEGLIVPVVKGADHLSLLELSDRLAQMAQAAAGRRLDADALSGATFTVSNIGAVGGSFGTPIIPHGTSAILSVGRAKSQPVVDGSSIVAAPLMPLSLSYDHRIIDGAAGRRFTAMLIENLEEPALFLA